MICGYWFLATQIDTFIRNGTALDLCAINTYSSSYPTSLVLKVLPKSSYKRITWNEIVILYSRFQLLVTGSVYGELDDPIINAFNVEDLDSLLQKIRNATADRNTSIVFDGEDALNYLEQLSNICARMKEMLALDATIMMVKSSNLSQSPQLVINGKVATSLYTNLVRAACNTSNNRKIAHQVYMN
jgi:hypothetical protein